MKIKTCPHCNGSASLTQNFGKNGNWYVYVRCNECFAQGKAYRCNEEPASTDWESNECKAAIRFWNMRNGVSDESQD